MELEAEVKNILLLPHPWFNIYVNSSNTIIHFGQYSDFIK